jgi:shikimate kinase
MGNIVITGFMGTGKTTVGNLVARMVGYRLFDTDFEIEKKAGMNVSAIFESRGEKEFRRMERETIAAAADFERTVIVTGGGAITFDENLGNMRRAGMIFCLCAEPGEILKRIKDDDTRPLLKGTDKLDGIRSLLEKRRAAYSMSDVMIKTDNKSTEEIAREIISAFEKDGKN